MSLFPVELHYHADLKQHRADNDVYIC